MLVTVLLMAAPVVAALVAWGSWGWVAAGVIVAAVEWAAMRRADRFSSRMWRSIGMGRRGSRERAAESVYVLSAGAGVLLLVGSLLFAR